MPAFDSKKPLGPVKIDPSVFKAATLGEQAAIVTAAKAYTEADVTIQPNTRTYSVVQQEGAFARVAVGLPEGGGYSAILKKVYGLWIVVVTGQDQPGKAAGEKYGLPDGWFSAEY